MTDKLWIDIVEFLRGSTNSLDYALYTFKADYLEDHMPFLEYLDSEIFYCDTCGWWCNDDESEDDYTCRDCKEEY
jgi:hypothetical protein